jgi:hypothetical protein
MSSLIKTTTLNDEDGGQDSTVKVPLNPPKFESDELSSSVAPGDGGLANRPELKAVEANRAVQFSGQNVRKTWANVEGLWQKSAVAKMPGKASTLLAPANGFIQREATNTFDQFKETLNRVGTGVRQGATDVVNQVGDSATSWFGDGFTDIRHDVQDLTDRTGGRNGLCSRCSQLEVSASWKDESQVSAENIQWTTPLARVIYHSSWCRMCRLLLSMLCRPEHDPFSHPEIEKSLQPEL